MSIERKLLLWLWKRAIKHDLELPIDDQTVVCGPLTLYLRAHARKERDK